MKNLRILTVLIVIVVLTALLQRNYSKNIQREDKKLQEKIISAPTPKPTTEPTPTLESDSSLSIAPSLSSESIDTSINNFIYPNSVVTNIGINSVVMQSNDSPQTITDWYKEKIKSFGMNVNSFVQTITNGNVLNRFVSAGSNFKINVRINKRVNDVKTQIEINLQ